MTLPGLAIQGSTKETQYLLSYVKKNKFPLVCDIESKMTDKSVTYYNQTIFSDITAKANGWSVLGANNIVAKDQVSDYYKNAVPRSALNFLAYKKLFTDDWRSISVQKSIPLANINTHRYEVLQILQALRTLHLDVLTNINICKSEGLTQNSLILTAKLGQVAFMLHLIPSPEVFEIWKLDANARSLELSSIDYEYDELKVFSDAANPFMSFHSSKYDLSPSLIWEEVIKTNGSLQNLLDEDWELLHAV
ncbi:MAG: hypothetical protein KDD37_06630 [Bdellovibrionales bacterium]|nr:hypothetical protein [Bdellovibrionales bacterium]